MLSFGKHELIFILLSIASLALAYCDDSPDLDSLCSPELTKMYPCLDYATGKANMPSSDCCTSAADVRRSNAVCLCYFIEHTHDGNANTKSLGIGFDRVIALPSNCKMANMINVSNICPNLLNLSPSSPDYSIFSASKANSSTSTATATASNGIKHRNTLPFSGITFTALLSSILLSIF